MNLVEKIGLVLTGPYSAPVSYAGDLLWVWVLALGYEQLNSFPLCFFLLSAGHVIINLVQLQQRKLFSNGTYGELHSEAKTLIQQKALRDGIPNIIIRLVINFPVINAFCDRKLTSCEIITSHHWFETQEGTDHFSTILEHEFAHARAHHVLKRALFASAFFCVGIGLFLYIMSMNLFPPEYTHVLNILTAFFMFRATTFLQVWYHRAQEFEADEMALAYTTPAKLIECLTFMRKHNPNEKILENIPEWARASHPYISSRVRRLLNYTS